MEQKNAPYAHDDHVKGSKDFFYLDHAKKYQGEGRKKISELWVSSAFILDTDINSEDVRVIRQEARHRLKEGYGIKVFSEPDKLSDWLEENEIEPNDRKDFIVHAGTLLKCPKLGKDIEIFVHAPFSSDSEDPFRATVRELYSSASPPIDKLHVDYEVVGRCQNPIFNIKRIEPIRIEIYKNEVPQVFVLREDFPIVPHLMCSSDGKTKSLCYSDVVDEELRLRMNGRFLVKCINNWFVKTARNELHHPDQPIEPFFLGYGGVIITRLNFIKPERLFNKFEDKEQSPLLQIDDDDRNENARWYASLWLCLPARADNIIRKLPRTLSELLGMFSNVQIFKYFEKQVLEIWNVRQNPQNYLSVFNNSVKALLDCKCLVALYISLSDSASSEIKKHDIRVFKLLEPFSKLLQMIGLEYDAQTKKLVPFPSKKPIDIPIEMLQIQCDFDSDFARQLNGVVSNYKSPRIAIVGVGALGSQVFTNCVRAGFGRWTLIDNDVIWPHNLARHSLGRSSIGKLKAHELAEHAKTILSDADVSSIAGNVFNHDIAEIAGAFSEADIIIDASTSIAAERVVALDVESAARRISVFLNQSGTYLTMLIEDTERNITLDFLEMQEYRILCTMEAYSDYFDSAESLAYSASCRDITSNISQDVIALSGAIISREIKNQNISDEAHVSIWKISNDEIIVKRHTADSWTILTIGSWQICVNNLLIEDMMVKRQERSPNETGGVLIGNCDSLRNRLYIVDMVFAPSDSIESPNSFIRGSESLPEKLIEISKKTHGSLYYVGEWHSHPTSSTSMSRHDEILLDVVTEWCEVDSGLGCIIIVGADKSCSVHVKMLSSEHSLSKSI